MLGDRSLIKKTQQTKEMYAKSVQQEEEAMNELMQEYENASIKIWRILYRTIWG